MVPFTSLLLPILLSAVAVFLVSSVLHMAVPGWHGPDWKRLPNEPELQEFLRKAGVPGGNYMLPYPPAGAGMRDPTFKERMLAGPIATIILRPGGMPKMGGFLARWFVYLLVVSALCAFNAAFAVGVDGGPHRVFHFVALPAFLAYALALWQDQIWYGKSTGTTIRNTIDGVIYAVVTGLVFLWLWPKG